MKKVSFESFLFKAFIQTYKILAFAILNDPLRYVWRVGKNETLHQEQQNNILWFAVQKNIDRICIKMHKIE